MNILSIAHKVANYKRVSLESIYEEVMQTCPNELKQKVGDFIHHGWYGEVYELAIDPEKVIKLSVALDENNAIRELDDIKHIESIDSPAVPKIYDYGILCDIDLSGLKRLNLEMGGIKDHGVAYYYVMERLYSLDNDEGSTIETILQSLHQIWDKSDPRGSEIKQRQFIFRNRQELRKEAIKRNKEEDTDEWDEQNVDGGLFQRILNLFEYMQLRGIVHHDIHGGNIMQNADGELKLVDLESIEIIMGAV